MEGTNPQPCMVKAGREKRLRQYLRNPQTGTFHPEPVAVRFWRYVVRGEGCWLWRGAVGSNGYGYLGRRGAHRVSYELNHGPIPRGLQVRHDCDTPLCVNPAHLRLGTVLDNARDKVERGRIPVGLEPPHYLGEAHPRAKLTAEAVRDIRASRAAGEKLLDIGRRHGVTKHAVWAVLSGRVWGHVR